MRKTIINHSTETSTDDLAVKKFLAEDGLEGETLLSFAESNEALYGYKGKGEAIKFITDKEIESKYAKKTDIVQSDWDEKNESDPSYIQNKPILGTAAAKDVPSEGNATESQVVLGNDTRFITDAEREKLKGIEDGAQKNIKPDWRAGTGDAAEILNKPSIPSKGTEISFDGEHILEGNTAENITASIEEVEKAVKANSDKIASIPAATVTGIKAGDKVLSLEGTNLTSTINLTIDENPDGNGKRYIKLLGIDNADLGKVDITEFIKDGMLESAELVKDPTIGEQAVTGTYLKLTWNTDSSKDDSPMLINVTELIDIYTQGTGINIDNKKISVDTDFIATVQSVTDAKTELKGTAEDTKDAETISGAKKYSDSLKSIIDDYTVNGKKISANPVLQSSDIHVENHYDESFTGDTVNSSINQIEEVILDNEKTTAASLNNLNGRVDDLYNAKYTGEVNVENTTGVPQGSVTIENDNASKKFTFNFSGIKGADGIIGKDGKSAYQIAKDNGYEGSEEDWLNSLKGNDGTGITIKGSKAECKEIGDCYIDDAGNLQLLETIREDGTPSFKNCGQIKGPQGDAAGFGTPTSSIDSNVGIPSVTVTASGPNTEKIFNFEFKNIKGEKGDTGTGITVKANEGACTKVGDCYIDSSGHLQLLETLNGESKIFTDCGEIKGPQGETGRGIASVTVNESNDDNGVNTYVFNFTDNKDPLTISVKNGSKGSKGATGSTYKPIVDDKGNLSWELVATPSAGDTATVNITGPQGVKGERGFYFTPSVSSAGILSWTNNSGDENILNPTPVNIMGPQGEAAGFGKPTASVLNNATGTPSVTITARGSNTEKIFDFAFRNIKGEKGEQGTGINVKANESDCIVDGDAYIENNHASEKYGHILILKIVNGERTFVDGGEVKGPQGETGKGIKSISYESTAQSGGENKLTINFTDNSSSGPYSIFNGSKGADAKIGSVTAEVTTNEAEQNPSVDVTQTEGTNNIHFKFHNLKGADGNDGIVFVPTVSSDGTLSWAKGNNSSGIPSPTNIKGKDGATPEIYAGYWYINNQNTNVKASGEDGSAATFRYISAEVDNTTGDPDVSVTTGNTSTNMDLTFSFTGLKGEPGSSGNDGDIHDIVITFDSNSNGNPSDYTISRNGESLGFYTLYSEYIARNKHRIIAYWYDNSRNIYKTFYPIFGNNSGYTSTSYIIFAASYGNEIETIEMHESSDQTQYSKYAIIHGISSTDSVLSVENNLISTDIKFSVDASPGSDNKRYLRLTGKDNADLGKVDIAEFVKDAMLNDVKLTESDGKTYINFTFNLDESAGGHKEINLDVTTLIGIYTQGNGIKIVNKEISVDTDVIATKIYVSDSISGTTTEITNLKKVVSGHTDDITELKNTVSGHTTQIEAISGKTDTNATAITNLQNKAISTDDTNKIYLIGKSSTGSTTLKEAELKSEDGVYIQDNKVYATAYYETSDENLKWFTGDIPVDFDKLKEIPKQYFIWRNRETPTNIGTSAQKVQKVYPELVSESNGHLNVDYAKLSVVALKAIDILNERIEKLELEIKELKK